MAIGELMRHICAEIARMGYTDDTTVSIFDVECVNDAHSIDIEGSQSEPGDE